MPSQSEINQFKKDGAVLIKGKFEKKWIEKLRNGINEDINNPSPRFVRHTKDKLINPKVKSEISISFFIYIYLYHTRIVIFTKIVLTFTAFSNLILLI